MPEEAYRCSSCKKTKPLAAFPPSKATNRSQWCSSCLQRNRYEGGWREGNLRYPFRIYRYVRCEWCNELFATGRAKTRFCSRKCKDEKRKLVARCERLVDKVTAPARMCPQCGDQLDPVMRTDARFCCNACMQASHAATRKAKWKTGAPAQYVSRAAIYRRDRGRCHLCGEHRPADDFHLDHLVPLALGGTHNESNLAVACPKCNMSRGARPLERQASLL